MFLLSKLITLFLLTSGTAGLLSYLIPYNLNIPENKLKNFFKAGSSIYDSREINEFKSEEKTKLDNTKSLHETWKKYKENAEEFKNLKYDEMKKLFQSIMEKEGVLTKLYEKNIDIIKQLMKAFDELTKISEKNLIRTGEFEVFKNLINILSQINKRVEEWGNILNKFVCIINSANQQSKEKEKQNCESIELNWEKNNYSTFKLEQNNSKSSNSGGAMIIKNPQKNWNQLILKAK